MTLQAIAARRADLQAQLQQEQQNQAAASRLVDTINGALQDCDFWASQLVPEGKPEERPRLELVRDDSPVAEEFVEQGA